MSCALAIGLAAGAALAQSTAPPSSAPPSQRQPRPNGGGDSSRGGIEVDEAGMVLDALKWAAKKKREADAKKKEEAARAAAAEKDRIAEAERDRARAEREADAARMKPIPDPRPERAPERSSSVPRRTGDPDIHRRPTLDRVPRTRPAPVPEPAPEPPVVTRPTPTPPQVRPAAPAQPIPSTPQPPVATAPAAPAPVPSVVSPPPPPPVAPPAAAAPPATPDKLIVLSDNPPWQTLALGLAVLLALLVTAVFAARQLMGGGAGSIEIRPGIDPGDTAPPEFEGLAGPQFSIQVGRGETSHDIHYPQSVEGPRP